MLPSALRKVLAAPFVATCVSTWLHPLCVVGELVRVLEGPPNWIPLASADPLTLEALISESLPNAELLEELLPDDGGATRFVIVVFPPIKRVLFDWDN